MKSFLFVLIPFCLVARAGVMKANTDSRSGISTFGDMMYQSENAGQVPPYLFQTLHPDDSVPQARQTQFDDSDMAATLEEAMTFEKYPTYTQYVSMMQSFAQEYPEICRLDTIGYSYQGRLILALKISDQAGKEEPEARFLYASSIHGDELVGFILLLRLADYLLGRYGSDLEVTGLVDSLEIWINPLSNPDGTYYPDDDESVVFSRRENARGIDLNRNYPDPASGDSDDTTGIERENQAMMLFMKKKGFTLSANLHSGAEVVNYPWDHTFALHADDAWYRLISREYADEAKAVDPGYMDLFTDGITNGAEWYIIHGGRQDYVNYYLEGREVTLELALTKKLESDQLDEFWNINRRSLLNYMTQASYGIRGRVSNRESGLPVYAKLMIPGHDSSYSVVHTEEENGYFFRMIKEGIYDLVCSAEGFISDTLTGIAVTDYNQTWLNIKLEPSASSSGIQPGNREKRLFTVYPNPAGNLIEARIPGPGTFRRCEIWITGLGGNIYLRNHVIPVDNHIRIAVDEIPQGYYILKIVTPENIFFAPFVKQ